MIRVALIDSGADDDAPVVARRDFVTPHSSPLRDREGPAPREGEGGLRHGLTLAQVILEAAPDAQLLDARVFGDRLATHAEAVAAALHWAADEGARLANLSLGLREDRPVLAAAVARALSAGLIIVASVPARGGPVYPAAYEGVIKVTGDARCAPGDQSWIGDAAADFGACAMPLPASPEVGGSSIATARVTGALARLSISHSDPVAALRAKCRFRGRERRGAPAA